MKGKTVPTEVRNLIIKTFMEEGVPVAKLAKEYNLNSNTIYNWIKNTNISDTGDFDKQKLVLENARLKKEKQELIDLIGRLTIDVDKLNKKKINCFEIQKLPKTYRLKLARVCIHNYPQVNKKLLASILKLNRGSLYLKSTLDFKDQILAGQVIELLSCNPCYGYRRVAIHFKWGYNKARRIMRKYNIYPKYKQPRYLVKKHDLGRVESKNQNQLKLLIQEIGITKPNQSWSTDFTYIRYKSSFLYLATVIDTYTKEIVGFHISRNHTTNLTLKALNKAITNYGLPEIHHSDQGTEYNSYIYQEYLQQNGIICSMSKKSSPWENGYQESFYGKFKFELGSLNQFQTEIEAIEAIYLQLHYYNNKRIHTVIKDIPANFRRKYFDLKQNKNNILTV